MGQRRPSALEGSGTYLDGSPRPGSDGLGGSGDSGALLDHEPKLCGISPQYDLARSVGDTMSYLSIFASAFEAPEPFTPC
ncbi:hypothetical protein PsYK624_063030 [Phanerochaete sordida]|uniref:Uncharacterized protein n=1 Tax=Phanerochaete sordida TaxID=48140 RepID=A0A9P3LDQ3_9APHY|nr:hypothetical protein PsYK624_063030 [Phanerochaete sordida]